MAELVGFHNSTVLIPTYDWMSYLDTFFNKIPHLKTYHHFRFDKTFPGTVSCKQYFLSQETAINILETDRNMPQVNLFKEFCEFYRPGNEDFVAPEVH